MVTPPRCDQGEHRRRVRGDLTILGKPGGETHPVHGGAQHGSASWQADEAVVGQLRQAHRFLFGHPMVFRQRTQNVFDFDDAIAQFGVRDWRPDEGQIEVPEASSSNAV